MSNINKEHWQLFLKDLAYEAGLTKAQLDLFLCMFSLENEGKKQSEITNILKREYSRMGNNFYGNHLGTLLTTLKNLSLKTNKSRWIDNLKIEYIESTEIILKSENPREIEDEILKLNKVTKERSIWTALRSTYPHWQKEKQIGIVESPKSKQELWSQLKKLGEHAPERMGMYIAESQIDTASGLPKNYRPKPFLEEVAKSTQGLKFKILGNENKTTEKVLLLNRDEANVVYCLCPSEFAPSINLYQGEKVLPQQPESRHAYLGAEMLGKEEWWGWIVNEMPPLSWLETARDTALELNAEQLAELLSQVKLLQGEVLHTFYRVVAARSN